MQSRGGAGEWDTEYASVSNAVLPFDRCCAHLGEEGWGRQAASYGDLQVRVYDLDDAPQNVERRVAAKGVADVERFAGKGPMVRQDLAPSWRRTVLSFDRDYGDYGGTANVDFRVRGFGKRTLVFVFMYSNCHSHEREIASVLASVHVP